MPVSDVKTADAEATTTNWKQQQAGKGNRNPLRPHQHHHHHHHHGAGAIGSAAFTVTERLYDRGHVCSHARCAANNPNYNIKASTPTKKFLVAKKNKPGGVGWEEPTKATTAAKSTTSNHDQSHALHSLTNSVVHNPNGMARDRSSLPYSKGRNVQQDRGLYALAQSVLDHSRARVVPGVDADAVPPSRKPSGSLGRKLSTPTVSSLAKTQQPQQKRLASSSGRNSVGSVVTESESRGQPRSWTGNPTHPAMRLPSADRVRPRDGSPSPKSSVTSVSITQVVTTSRGEGGEQEQTHGERVEVAPSSPTASVGSTHGGEVTSGVKETDGTCAPENYSAPSGSHSEPAAQTSDVQVSSLGEEKHQQSPRSPAVPCTQQQIITDSPASSVNSNPLTLSPGLACATHEASPASNPGQVEDEVLSSSPRKVPEEATATRDSVSPSSTPELRPAESPLSMVVSDSSRPSPSSASSSGTGRYDPRRGFHGPSVETAAAASAKKPSRISKPSVAQCRMEPPSLGNASQLARKFVTDAQGTSGPREPASTKGVRSIELRGGKAQSYSRTTTVTSLNLTTTTVESAPPMSESSSEANSNFGLSRSVSAAAAIRPSWQATGKDNPDAGVADSSKENADMSAAAQQGLKYSRRSRSTTVVEELLADSEAVSLKHGEVAERRLSEEWMTNHALEGVVKQIADKDHRVKVLVHAFETLTNLTDSESQDNDENDRQEAQLEYEAMPAAQIAA